MRPSRVWRAGQVGYPELCRGEGRRAAIGAPAATLSLSAATETARHGRRDDSFVAEGVAHGSGRGAPVAADLLLTGLLVDVAGRATPLPFVRAGAQRQPR